MRKLFIMLVILFVVGVAAGAISASAVEVDDRQSAAGEAHNWKQMNVETQVIPTDPHEFTYWKNFIRHTRVCEVSLKVKTTVYYCDIHHHTKSKTHLEEKIHSYNH